MSNSKYFFNAIFITILGLLILSGCGGYGARTEGAGTTHYPRVPVRDFLSANQIPKFGYGAYGYVLLTERPDTSTLKRYRQICQSFLNEFVPEDNYSPLYQHYLMVTFWLLDSLYKPNSKSDNCDSLLQHYDFPRAAIILSAVGKQGIVGPLLVAFTTSYKTGMPVSNELVLDMTTFTEEDINVAYRIWKDRISLDPNEWNEGFSRQIFVLEFRNLINKYGEQILNFFKG